MYARIIPWALLCTLAAAGCSEQIFSGDLRDGGGSDRDGAVPRPPRTDECGNGVDDDDNGRIDDGCPCGMGETQACFGGATGSRGVGVCGDGVQVCAASTEWGDWGDYPCTGDTLASEETCDGTDEDCDGALDEDCPCTAGDTRACGLEFLAPPCMGGTQTCRDGRWSGCEGAVGPVPDTCGDSVDNDCDGDIDESCTCTPTREQCRDGVDNDCDGEVDEPACTPDWPPADAGVPDAGTSDGGVIDCSGATRGWRTISAVDGPPAMTMVGAWTGRELFVWGTASGVVHGRRYDPVTNVWSYVTTGGAPSARIDPGFAWTGREVLIWGGRDSSGLHPSIGDGAAYDAALGTWRPIASAGAPTPRTFYASVWTGTELIVWGGRRYVVGATDLADGGRYDPVSDTWRPMSTAGAPSARYNARAVWTGHEMIVWGGYVGTAFTDTGGIYDPAADSWRPLPTTGGPGPRQRPVVEWTGSELAVWGGSLTGSIYMNTGSLFDPATNLWRPITTTAVPEGRSQGAVVGVSYEGVSTTRGFLVWGGEFDFRRHSPDNLLREGSVYDAAAETWTPIPETGAPEGRTGHVAVWTGCSLIIWGGTVINDTTGSAEPTFTGGIWTP